MADTLEETDISAQLLELYDEFTVFNDDCAFLGDAFASMQVPTRASMYPLSEA